MRYEIPRKYPNCISFWMPLVLAPWLSDDVPRHPSYGINITQLIEFLCASLDFYSKTYKWPLNYCNKAEDITSLLKQLDFFRSHSGLSQKSAIPFQEYVTKGISNRSLTMILFTNLDRSIAKIISFPREHEWLNAFGVDSMKEIITKTLGVVLCPSTAMCRRFP